MKNIPTILLALILFAGCAAGDTEGRQAAYPPAATQPAAQATLTSEPYPRPLELTATPVLHDETKLASIPGPQGYAWKLVAEGLDRPLGLVTARDGSQRLFVVEQKGVVRILLGDTLLESPFLDIRQKVGTSQNEQGLLGLAFDPAYEQNGLFYINYTDRRGDTVIARYRVSDDPDLADPASEEVLLTQKQPYANHNGGDLAFGPDGFLYIASGDGGSGGDPQGNGQNRNTLLGKILRIDVSAVPGYRIPEGNPFSSPEGRPEIWAYGLRNPWRISFDRLTGDLYISDVGQDAMEEVNFQAAGAEGGANYGWNYFEGTRSFRGTPPEGARFEMPVIAYPLGEECSITGGYVYRGQDLPDWQGVYVYADFCSGRVWGAVREADGAFQTRELFRLEQGIASFGEDESGELYILNLYSGKILRLEKE